MSGTYSIKYSDYATTQREILIPPMTAYPPSGTPFPLQFAGYRHPKYGEEIWTNFLHLLENFSYAEPPEGAVVGQLWFNNSTTPGTYKFLGTDGEWHALGRTVVPVVVPVASFTKSAVSGVSPLSITFTDTSTNVPTSWSWNFGDGTTSTTRNPTKLYATAGTYNVVLTVTNGAGSDNSAAQTVIATSSVITPVASFTKSVTSGVAPLSTTFTDTSTNSPTSWLWTFGDGTTSTIQNPTKSYATAGTYSVTLQVTNSAGNNTSAAQVITVTAAIVTPVASFTKSTASGATPLSIIFTDTSTNGPTSWLWTFGDGTTSTIQNPTKSYATAGTYSVTLKATNSAGTSTTTAQVITVTAAVVEYNEVFTAPTTATTGTPFAISISGAEPNSIAYGKGYLNGSTTPVNWVANPLNIASNGTLSGTDNYAPNGTQGTWVQTVTFANGHTRSQTITATCVEPNQITDTNSSVGIFTPRQVTYSTGYIRSAPLLLSTTDPAVTIINGWYTSVVGRPGDQVGILALLSIYTKSGAAAARAEFDGWISASRVTPGLELYGDVYITSVRTFCTQATTGVAYSAQFAAASVNEGATVACTFRTAGVPAGTTFGYIVYGNQAPPTMLAASNADFAAHTGTFVTNASESGTFSVTVLNDGLVEAPELFYVDVTLNGVAVAGTNVVKINSVLSAPVASAWPVITGVKGSPVDSWFGTTYFTAPSGDPLTFSATGLPPGLIMGTDGHIVGTMTTAGSYYPVVTATGLSGLATTMTGLWTVQP